ncbi:universal stress protein [Mucilaginibacter sp. UYCu711]|uniref:universal stress protein n=1 Tax=Mucilaginibacter sp. UYCu711 TaxID=3156339 RepID=UPI003D1FDA65
MKTIAVLTDFSERADNAAMYAVHLAQHLKVNVLLYNSFFVASAHQLSAQVAWPMEDFNELQHDSEKEMQLLLAKLKKELTLSPEGFTPAIECGSHGGNLVDNLDELLADREVIVLVMGSHKKGVATLMTANHMRELIDKALLPVLIIPEYKTFAPIHKIAFATDLHGGDIEFIHSLASLARSFDAEILIAHTTKTDDNELVDTFLNKVTNNVDYHKIYFRPLKDMSVNDGLNWLIEQGQIDMLVMVHRHKSLLERFFTRSNSQHTAADSEMPLLIYPYPVKSMIVF